MPWERIVSLRIFRVTAFASRTLSSPSSSSTDGPRRVIPRSSSSRARASTCGAKFRPFGRATRWWRIYVSLSLCVCSYRVCGLEYVSCVRGETGGHGSSRPHPPTRTRSRDVRTPISGTTGGPAIPARRPVGRSRGRSVGRPRPPRRRRRRRRPRPHSSTFRASHVRDRAILFLRHHRVRLRASLGVASSRALRRFPTFDRSSRSYPRSREDTRRGWE